MFPVMRARSAGGSGRCFSGGWNSNTYPVAAPRAATSSGHSPHGPEPHQALPPSRVAQRRRNASPESPIKVVMSSGRSLERKAASNAPIKVGSGLEPQRSRGTPSIQTRPFSRRTRSRDCCASKCSTRRGQLAKPYSRASTNCASCRRSGVTTPDEGRTAGPSRVEGCASGPSHTDTRASASAFPSRCCFCSVSAWLRRFSSEARGGSSRLPDSRLPDRLLGTTTMDTPFLPWLPVCPLIAARCAAQAGSEVICQSDDWWAWPFPRTWRRPWHLLMSLGARPRAFKRFSESNGNVIDE